MPSLRMTINGEDVEVKQLTTPRGQFTHFYIDRNGDPEYIIVRQVDDKTYATFSPDVDKAFAAALASGRWCFLLGVLTTPEEGQDPQLDLYKTTCDFPYAAFPSLKAAVVQDLDQDVVGVAGKLNNADLATLLNNDHLVNSGKKAQAEQNPGSPFNDNVVSIKPQIEIRDPAPQPTEATEQEAIQLPQIVGPSEMNIVNEPLPEARPLDQSPTDQKHLQDVQTDFAKTLKEMNDQIKPVKQEAEEQAGIEKEARSTLRGLNAKKGN